MTHVAGRNPVSKPSDLLDPGDYILENTGRIRAFGAGVPLAVLAITCCAGSRFEDFVAAESMRKRWWRLRRTSAAGLGLFALLLQAFVSFGHVHARDFVARDVTTSRAVAAQAVSKSSASGQAQIPGGLPDDDCPICAMMHMAAAGLLPAPPSIADPADFTQVLRQAYIEAFDLGVTRHVLFQTRAPPIA